MEFQQQFIGIVNITHSFRKFVTCAALLASFNTIDVHADEKPATAAPAPLILVLPDSSEFAAGDNYGVIGYLINRSENKRTATQVDNLRKLLDEGEMTEKVQQAFACLHIASANAQCRDVLIAGARDNITNLIREKSYTNVIELRLVTLMSDQRYWARATVIEHSNVAGHDTVNRRYSASYETRAPAELVAKAKADPTPLQQYWLEGDPARLKTEVLASLPELRDLLAWMAENSTGSSPNKAWQDLPDLKGLREAGRLPCRGVSCTQLRLVKESGSRLWIVNRVLYGAEYGPTVTSVDENAALNGIFPYNMINSGH